jgi:hypothetical protein
MKIEVAPCIASILMSDLFPAATYHQPVLDLSAVNADDVLEYLCDIEDSGSRASLHAELETAISNLSYEIDQRFGRQQYGVMGDWRS